MVEHKRFHISQRPDGRIIATEKRKNDIERKVIKPHEIMKIKSNNMNEFYQTMSSTFGKFTHHRRRNNWVVMYDTKNFNGGDTFKGKAKSYNNPVEVASEE